MPRPETVLDREHLARATGRDEALMAELLDMLRRELPERQRRLDAALRDGDLETAADAAHKLQGSASYTGAVDLETRARRLEDVLRAGDTERLQAARDALDEAIAALEAFLSGEAG